MAEHTRGQGRDDRNSNERNRSSQRKDLFNERAQTSNRGDNMDASSSMSRKNTSRGPRMTKWDLSSSDYDGQLSDE